LLGVVFGGALEYASNIGGLNKLYILALVIYVLSLVPKIRELAAGKAYVMQTDWAGVPGIARKLVLGGGWFFFLDKFVNQSRHCAATKTAWRFVLRFSLGITHIAFVKGFFRADVVVVVKGQFATLTALQIFCHVRSCINCEKNTHE